MTATAHALVAAAIATKFNHPLAAVSLSLASHFIMDSVPHWDLGTNWRKRSKEMTGLLAIVETIAGITIAYFLFMGKAPTGILLLAIITSLLPDWLETPWYIFYARQNKNEPQKNAGFWEKMTFRIYKIENIFHTKTQFPLGAITQVLTVAFFLYLLS